MRHFYLCYLLLFILISCGNRNRITISGKVTDFDNLPLDSVSILIMDKNFNTIDSALSDKSGNYKLQIKKGLYNSLAAVKRTDYAKNKLEYWAWNIPAFKDLIINIKNDKLELYGTNVFRIQGGFPSYSIYVRPMSLTRFQKNAQLNDTVNFLAPLIEKVEVKVQLDNQELKLLSIQKVYEYSDNQKIVGYFLQTEYKETINKYGELDISITDKETGDKGETRYFIENKN
jgi:hypothetical protein